MPTLCNINLNTTSDCPIGGINQVSVTIKALGTIAGVAGGTAAGTVLGTADASSMSAGIVVTNSTAEDIASAFSGTFENMVVDQELLPEDVEICAVVTDACGTSAESCDTAIVISPIPCICEIEIGGVMVPISTGDTLVLDSGASVTLLSDCSLNYSRPVHSVVQNFVANNVMWPNYPPQADPNTYPGQLYDARSLTYTNLQGMIVPNIGFTFNPVGQYDDSIAIDFSGDGIVDYLVTQEDFLTTPGVSGYSPWADASPLQVVVNITAVGTTVVTTWNGVQVLPGTAPWGGGGVGRDGGFDNTGGITLATLGFNPDGSIPSNNFTTNEFRFGSMNDTGPGSHNITWQFPNSLLNPTLVESFNYTYGICVLTPNTYNESFSINSGTPYPLNLVLP